MVPSAPICPSCHLGVPERLDMMRVRGPEPLGYEMVDRLPESRRSGTPEHQFRCVVEISHALHLVDGDNRRPWPRK